MFGNNSSRSNVKKINELAKGDKLEQLKLNIFMLMNDLAISNESNGYIKDQNLNNGLSGREIEEYFGEYFSKYSRDFIKELITPEVTESQFVSNKEFSFIRDVYSMNGDKLQSFSDLKKKYGKEFDEMHKNIIADLQAKFSIKNDLIYLEQYLDNSNYSLDQLILFNNDSEKKDYVESNPYSDCKIYLSVNEAINIISDKDEKEEGIYTKKEEILRNDVKKSLKNNQDQLLIFFFQKEFLIQNDDLLNSYINDKPEMIGRAIEKIINSDTSAFVQHINEKYNVNYVPTEEMVNKFNEFKDYYKHCKLLNDKNNLLYEKDKISDNNTIKFNDDEDNLDLNQICVECSDMVNTTFQKKGRFF